MPGDHDERSFFNDERDLHRLWLAEGSGVCLVQKLHAAVTGFAGLLHQRPKRLHGQFVLDGGQRLAEKAVQFGVDTPQHPGVVVVGRHAAQTEQHEGLQTAHVLVRLVPEIPHVVVEAQPGTGRVDVLGQLVHGLRVKVDVRDGREQPFHQQKRLFGRRGAALADELLGVGDQRPGQSVLRCCRLGALAADARRSSARRAVRRLFTLKTKHLLVHPKTSFPRMLSVWTG